MPSDKKRKRSTEEKPTAITNGTNEFSNDDGEDFIALPSSKSKGSKVDKRVLKMQNKPTPHQFQNNNNHYQQRGKMPKHKMNNDSQGILGVEPVDGNSNADTGNGVAEREDQPPPQKKAKKGDKYERERLKREANRQKRDANGMLGDESKKMKKKLAKKSKREAEKQQRREEYEAAVLAKQTAREKEEAARAAVENGGNEGLEGSGETRDPPLFYIDSEPRKTTETTRATNDGDKAAVAGKEKETDKNRKKTDKKNKRKKDKEDAKAENGASGSREQQEENPEENPVAEIEERKENEIKKKDTNKGKKKDKRNKKEKVKTDPEKPRVEAAIEADNEIEEPEQEVKPVDGVDEVEKRKKKDKQKKKAIKKENKTGESEGKAHKNQPEPTVVDAVQNRQVDGSEIDTRNGQQSHGRFIAFIGNLPYTANHESVAAHFQKIEPAQVRVATEKNNPEKCRGFAFVEFEKFDRMRTCLQLYHHSSFDDGKSPARRINVELTAGGGGKSQFRKDKLKEKNQKLAEEREKIVKKQKTEKSKTSAQNGDASEAGGTRGPNEQDQNDFVDVHPSRLRQMDGNKHGGRRR